MKNPFFYLVMGSLISIFSGVWLIPKYPDLGGVLIIAGILVFVGSVIANNAD